MSKPSRSRPKKVAVGLGNGRSCDVEAPAARKTFTINLDDDDDEDDFKPSKANPYPSKTKNKREEMQVGGAKQRSMIEKLEATKTKANGVRVQEDQDDFIVISPEGSEANVDNLLEPLEEMLSTGNHESEISPDCSEPFFEEEEDDNGVQFLLATKNHQSQPIQEIVGKTSSAWKNLMEQMQKNQKKDTVTAVAGGASKKTKSSVKRGLTLSPLSKKGVKPKAARSPLKKNPRLGGPSALISSESKLVQDSTGNNCKTIETNLEGNDESPDRKALIEMGTNINVPSTSASSTDMSSKKPAKVAPIFLPPAERKALELSKVAKMPSTSSAEVLLESLVKSSSLYDGPGTFTENPDHFSGNVVILNDEKITEDPYGGLKTKVCPFYKKLPGVPFCVDAFNYGLIPGMEVYFLSHFHSDHYIGLTKKFCKTIICTHPTGNLVRMKLYVEDKYIRKLCVNKPYIILDTEVTLIDANHCPGSVIFIFRLKNGQVIVHTGDFRFTKDMLDSPFLSGLRVDSLYLDTTYCSSEYDFPTQCESISNVIIQVKRRLEYRPKTLILCGSYLIGKERVYFTLAEAIGSKVFANYDKRKVINALENPKFTNLLTADDKSSNIHVVPMFSISAKNLQEYLVKYPQYTNIIGIKPSGWQFSAAGSGCSVKSHYGDTVTLIGVPYSEHSSYSELKEFVTKIRPKHVQPTVNVGNPKKRSDMMSHIDSWLSSCRSLGK